MALNPSERDALIRRYEEGPGRLRAAWEKVPAEARQWRPGEGKWSAHEVVCHAADSETNAALRIRFLVADPNPTIFGYDQERWAKNLGYHAASPDLALKTVEAVRGYTVPLLRQHAREGVGRRGHPHRVRPLHGRGLAPDLRRAPREALAADRPEQGGVGAEVDGRGAKKSGIPRRFAPRDG